MLAANLNLERIDGIVLPHNGLGTTGAAYLVGRDHRFVNKILATGAYTGRDPLRRHRQRRRQQSGQGLYTNYQGVPVIGVYRWLPERDAAMVVEETQNEAFAPARKLALEIGAIGVGVVLLMSIGIYFASRRIARPIQAITATATAVTAGDLTRVAPVTTSDEIGTLAGAFNDMTGQLRDTLEGLEQRVADRTEELGLQNAELEALHETSLGVMHRLDIDDLLHELLARASSCSATDHGYIYMLERVAGASSRPGPRWACSTTRLTCPSPGRRSGRSGDGDARAHRGGRLRQLGRARTELPARPDRRDGERSAAIGRHGARRARSRSRRRR